MKEIHSKYVGGTHKCQGKYSKIKKNIIMPPRSCIHLPLASRVQILDSLGAGIGRWRWYSGCTTYSLNREDLGVIIGYLFMLQNPSRDKQRGKISQNESHFELSLYCVFISGKFSFIWKIKRIRPWLVSRTVTIWNLMSER